MHNKEHSFLWNGLILFIAVCGFNLIILCPGAQAASAKSEKRPPTATSEKEPNNELSQANLIPFNSEVTGTLYPGKDVDYYHLKSQDFKRREVIAAELTNQAPNIAPYILVYNDKFKIFAMKYAPKGSPKSTAFFAAAPGRDYYFALFSNKIDMGGMLNGAQMVLDARESEKSRKPYTFRIRLATPQDGYRVDDFEPNDSLETATAITLGQEVKGTLDPGGDLDIYRLSLDNPRKEVVQIKLHNTSDAVAPNLVLMNEKQEYLGYAWGGKGCKEVELNLVTEGRSNPCVAVFSNSFNYDSAKYNFEHLDPGARSDQFYTLTTSLRPIATDAHEPNDSVKQASSVPLGDTEGTLNPAFDVDWYRVTAARDGKMKFTLLNPSLQLTPHFIVYNQDREELGDARTSTRGAAKVSGEIKRVRAGDSFYVQVYSGFYKNQTDQGQSEEKYTLRVENRGE